MNSPLKVTVQLQALADLLKIDVNRIARFTIFHDSTLLYVCDLFKSSPPKVKDKVDWCFINAKSYANEHGPKPDWSLYDTIKKRYPSSPIKQDTSKGEQSSQKHKEQEERTQQLKDDYRIKCEKRSLEYMQRPGSQQKASQYGKFGFIADMKPTESINLSYEDMSANYITMQMVKFATEVRPDLSLHQVGSDSDIPQKISTPQSMSPIFSDGQPIIPNWGSLYDQLDEMDDDQLKPSTVIFDENISQNTSRTSILLKQTGLFT